jgi:hypothetical protein
LAHHVDQEVNRFIEQLLRSGGHLSSVVAGEALKHVFARHDHLKIDIKSPEATVHDDVTRVQDLRSLGVEDHEMKDHILSSASAQEAQDKEKYAELVFHRATVLTNKEHKGHKQEAQIAQEKEQELKI